MAHKFKRPKSFYPKVSIIIPVYNGEKYIEGCFENLQKINYDNLEIVIIDDGSTDKSRELIYELEIPYKGMYNNIFKFLWGRLNQCIRK